MENSPDSSDDDSSPLSPSAARAIDGDAANADLEAGVRPAPGDARTGPPRQNRYALIAAAALTAVAIVVIENLNRVHGADDSNFGSTPSPWYCSLGVGWPGRTT